MPDRFIVNSELNPDYLRTGWMCEYYGVYNVVDTVTDTVVFTGRGAWGRSDAYTKRRELEEDAPRGIVTLNHTMYWDYTDRFKLSRMTTRRFSRPVDAKGLGDCTVLLLYPVTELGLNERHVVDELLRQPSVKLLEVRMEEDWREVREAQIDSNRRLGR